MEFIKNVNTYITLAEADEIAADELDEESEDFAFWQGLTDTQKQRKILKATRLVNELPFRGRAVLPIRPLPWPRYIDGRYFDCPAEVKAAIVVQAIQQDIRDTSDEVKMQKLGVKSYSVKGASISFTDSSNQSVTSNGLVKSVFEEYLVHWIY